MKNANANKGTKVKGVATKATKTSKVTPVIEATDEVVLDAKSDITETEVMDSLFAGQDETVEPTVEPTVAEGYAVCKPCGNEKEQTVENFSPSKNGGFRPICKPCQTQASLAWTTKRADYRKDYQRATQLINLGIPAIVPNAKDWKAGDVLMTVEYTRDGVTYLSREAEVVYAEMKQAQATARANAKAEIDAQNAELKTQRANARAEAKQARDAEKLEARASLATARANAKAERDTLRQEKADVDRADRQAKAVERANERAEANAVKAETARLEREQKETSRAEARNQKALAKAQEVLDKAEARKQLAIDKAMSATA